MKTIFDVPQHGTFSMYLLTLDKNKPVLHGRSGRYVKEIVNRLKLAPDVILTNSTQLLLAIYY